MHREALTAHEHLSSSIPISNAHGLLAKLEKEVYGNCNTVSYCKICFLSQNCIDRMLKIVFKLP